MRETKIDIPIYYGYLNIIIGKDEADLVEIGKKFEHKEDVSKYGAFTWSNYDADNIFNCFIAMNENCSNHLLAHEVAHLVNAVFIHINAALDRHNDEPQAYLTGWFFKEIEQFLTVA